MSEQFEYTTVTRLQATTEPEFGSLFSTSPYLRIERHLLARSVPGAKKDLITGDRVYRIHVSHLPRLNLDLLERRIIPTTEITFVLGPTDPTIGIKSINDTWIPVGP